MKNKKNKSGFILIEVLVAVVIISSSMLAIVSVASKSLSLAQTNLKNYKAGLSMEEAIEAVKIVRAGGWSTISSQPTSTNRGISWSSGTWTIVSTPQVDSQGFTRTIVFYPVYRDSSDDIIASGGTLDAGTKRVVITISWTDHGRSKSQTAEFYIANIF